MFIITMVYNNTLRTFELEPLEKIPSNYPKTLLTLDEINTGVSHNGIKQVNLLDWLLDR